MKTLILDIEISPIIAYVWDLKEQYIGLNQIQKDWEVMAWSAKWLDRPACEIEYMDRRDGSERVILKRIWSLLNEADIVITQNGQSFDGPKLNARFMLYGMNPPSPYQHLDTYRIVKRVSKFTSNKLEYLTDKLNTKYKKLSHSKFPGMSLWSECLRGNKQAWEEMRLYNMQDVLSTEELYNRIKAWAPDSMPKPYFVLNRTNCGRCGFRTQNRGFTRNRRKHRLHCQNSTCGAWTTTPVKKEDA